MHPPKAIILFFSGKLANNKISYNMVQNGIKAFHGAWNNHCHYELEKRKKGKGKEKRKKGQEDLLKQVN